MYHDWLIVFLNSGTHILVQSIYVDRLLWVTSWAFTYCWNFIDSFYDCLNVGCLRRCITSSILSFTTAWSCSITTTRSSSRSLGSWTTLEEFFDRIERCINFFLNLDILITRAFYMQFSFTLKSNYWCLSPRRVTDLWYRFIWIDFLFWSWWYLSES